MRGRRKDNFMGEDLFYKCPTGIYFASDGIQKVGKILAANGYRKAFLIYGGHSLKDSGNLDKLHDSLAQNGIEFKEKGGVKPNPEIQFVKDVLPEVKAFKPDVVLAVGGGSVLDTAKSLCASYYYEGDPLDLNTKKYIPTRSLPLCAVPTIAAAGSEMSDSCVMSDYKTGFKGGFNSLLNRPAISIEDPSLTWGVSEFQTCCGLVDIISHSFERYFSPSSLYEPCDYLALGVMKDIVDITPVLLKDLKNPEARRSMLIASTLSHNGITSFGKAMRFKCHQVEHQLSGKHPEIAHGLGLRFLLPEFLEINKDQLGTKIVRFGHELFGVSSQDPEKSISAFRSYLDKLPLVKTMAEAGISKEEQESYLKQLRV
jgi:alcohol dehydrogenase